MKDSQWQGQTEKNKQAKRANLPEGRDAKLQVQNGWLGCRLEKEDCSLAVSARGQFLLKGEVGLGGRSRMSCFRFWSRKGGGE